MPSRCSRTNRSDLEIRDQDGRAAGLVLQPEEDPIGHPLVGSRTKFIRVLAPGRWYMIRTYSPLSISEAIGEVEVGVDVRDRREVGVVNDAVTARSVHRLPSSLISVQL